MWSISTNILTVLANFLGIHNSIFSKNIGRDCGNTNHGWIHIEKWVLDKYNTSYIEHMSRNYPNRQVCDLPK